MVDGKQLHSLVESLCVRLHLFAGDYPVFVAPAVKAIMEHKNLQRTDRATLDSFCKMFELDWRGDHSVANREQFMANNPVYLSPQDQPSIPPTDNGKVTQQLQAACQPYLPGLVQKLKQA